MRKEYMVINTFVAKTPDGNKQLAAGQVIRISEESALQLIESGKIKAFENKTEPISQEVLNAIFTDASERLSTIYSGGEFGYCRTHHPELYQAERDALNQVDKLWFDALAGKVSLEVFKEAVRGWGKSVAEIIKVKNS